MPTSSRWLAVSSDLCFKYDSVYARPRRRNLETAVAAIVTATGPSDASRATAGAGRASATAIATATGPSDASRATAATNAFPEPVLVQGSGADPTGGQDHRAFEA